MLTKRKFDDKHLSCIEEIINSYIKTLLELLFVLRYQPDKYKSYVHVYKLLSKFSKAGVRFSDDLLNLINQYLLR